MTTAFHVQPSSCVRKHPTKHIQRCTAAQETHTHTHTPFRTHYYKSQKSCFFQADLFSHMIYCSIAPFLHRTTKETSFKQSPVLLSRHKNLKKKKKSSPSSRRTNQHSHCSWPINTLRACLPNASLRPKAQAPEARRQSPEAGPMSVR